MPPKNGKPVAFSMQRGERIEKMRDKSWSFRTIAKKENISVSRAFNILAEYHHRKKLIAANHWTYGLSTRAQGILYANDIMCLQDLRFFVHKHGADMPNNVNGVGKRLYAEIIAFVDSKTPSP